MHQVGNSSGSDSGSPLNRIGGHVLQNSQKSKFISVALMAIVGIFGIMLATQTISPTTSAEAVEEGTVMLEYTTNQYIDKPKLNIDVSGSHVFFRFTYEVESLDIDCEWDTPDKRIWIDYFSDSSNPRDSDSYPITQRDREPNQYVCFLIIYTDAEASGRL